MKWFRVDLAEGQEIQPDDFLFFYEQLFELLREKGIKIEQTKQMVDKQGKLLPFHLKNEKYKPNVWFNVVPKNKLIAEDLKLSIVFGMKTTIGSAPVYTSISGILDIPFEFAFEKNINLHYPPGRFNSENQSLVEFISTEIERSLNLMEEVIGKGLCGLKLTELSKGGPGQASFNDAKKMIEKCVGVRRPSVHHTAYCYRFGNRIFCVYGSFKKLYDLFKDLRRRKLVWFAFAEFEDLNELKELKGFYMLTDYSSGYPIIFSS